MISPPTTTSAAAVGAPATEVAPAPEKDPSQKQQFGRIILDISNSVLPDDKLMSTPSSKDGLPTESELQIRSLACDLVQIAGKLLKIPQVAMATACVLFHRFYYAKSMIRVKFDEVAMAALGLACKIEECPRRTRDIINVFKHIKQVRSGNEIKPMVLDGAYIALKNQVIKAERRILKELGFCVHVKHPHKVIVTYLKWLKEEDNTALLQMSWNFMNDSLRTDVFVRYPPETIAVACIYLSARKLKVALPKNPSWFAVLAVEEDDIKACCYSMICLYNRKKPNQDELEAEVDKLRRKQEQSRRAARGETSSAHTASNTPNQSTPPSRSGSPAKDGGGGDNGEKSNNGTHHKREKIEYENGTNRSIMDSNFVRRARAEGDADDDRGRSKSRKHRGRSSRSRSSSLDRGRGGGGRGGNHHHRGGGGDHGDHRSSSKKRSRKRSPVSPVRHSAAAHSPSKKSKKHRHRSRERYSAGDYYNQDSKNGGYHESGRSRKVRDERDRDYRR